jgi:hypothetical protein
MLFDCGMERLTAIITRAVNEHLLSPLAGCSAMQRLSIYADDMVLFLKPTRPDLVAAWETLEIFGNASSLHDNYKKSSTTLIRGSEDDKLLTETTLGCLLVNFLINYLGLLLALCLLTKAQSQLALDKIIGFMLAWQRGMIARQGRLILIKMVVAAKAIQQLLVADAPVWMLEEIEKWQQGFFWAGKESTNGGQCLVAQNSVCKPYTLLGFDANKEKNISYATLNCPRIYLLVVL